MMMELVAPTTAVHRSDLDALAEYQAEGGSKDLEALHLREPAAFERYAESVRHDGLPPQADRPAGWVPMTMLWWVDGIEYLGRVSVRHRLTPELRSYGGHIGYDVRPSARRRGHATRMLAAALPLAYEVGVDPALITCRVTNLASRKVIESNGGQLAEQKAEMLYFWVPTGL